MPNTRILVVDDDDVVRRFIASVLVREGYEVLEAGHGIDAALIGRGVDLLICDIVMPEMNGFELVAYLCEYGDISRVLMISGMPLQVRHSSRGPAQIAYLWKPFDGQTLLDTVQSLLG